MSTKAPNDSPSFWFPAKRYGWGWGPPVAWQGWVVMTIWFAVVVSGASILAGRHWIAYAVFMILMVAMLLAICFAKGEKLRWQWGK